LKFADPQLNEKDLAQAYTDHYYPSNGNGGRATYENTPEEILRQTFGKADAEQGPLSGKSLLDFGCGVGRLCKIAREYGIRTTGIEFDPRAREVAEKAGGLDIYSSIEHLSTTISAARFDWIIMWDVIEHLRQPWCELEKLSSLLRPDGLLLLTTPNVGSLRAQVLGKRWENIVNPTHFYYFTRRSLRLALGRAGFSEIREWRFPVRYPHHTTLQRFLHRALLACHLEGELMFVAQNRTPKLAGKNRPEIPRIEELR
jgi:2-polyprenyl-3-methyl-5-hydroxy-6-metoxy-1,4-benzoquinol methylase